MTTLLVVYAIVSGLATLQTAKMVNRKLGWRYVLASLLLGWLLWALLVLFLSYKALQRVISYGR